MALAKLDNPGDDLADCLRTIERSRRQRSRLLMETGPSEPDLTQALLDAAALFDELGIRYALIGGLAAMYYGRSRFTEDVDFIAASGHEELLATHATALDRWHFDPASTWKLYHRSGAEIDIWKDAHTDEMVGRAIVVRLAGRELPIAEAHDLIAMKLRAGRPQDDYDISEILKHQQILDERIRSLVEPAAFERYVELKRRTRRD